MSPNDVDGPALSSVLSAGFLAAKGLKAEEYEPKPLPPKELAGLLAAEPNADGFDAASPNADLPDAAAAPNAEVPEPSAAKGDGLDEKDPKVAWGFFGGSDEEGAGAASVAVSVVGVGDEGSLGVGCCC